MNPITYLEEAKNYRPPQCDIDPINSKLILKGDFTLNFLTILEKELNRLNKQHEFIKVIDLSRIGLMDTAGALSLSRFILELKKNYPDIAIIASNKAHETLLELIMHKEVAKSKEIIKIKSSPWLFFLGKWTIDKLIQIGAYLSFVGETFLAIWGLRLKSRNFHWRYVFTVVNQVGCGSLPIVALMSFLVGIVLAYQLAIELQLYGADIYVVDATGIAILREFSPLITAIILAGKTSTSFAALIGSMKINEEIDALSTMGISPIQRLVLPRILALLIAVPLLTVWASLFGILGSMLMSQLMLKINYSVFIQRFVDMVSLKQYVLGMIKTPFFACIISVVGCFQGLQVSNSADSVGAKTTQAAVQSIFLIIIADALFSVIYSWKGL